MPERIQLSRKKGWRKPENAVVVSRPSKWGNPFLVPRWGLPLAIDLYSDIVRGFWNPTRLVDHSDADVHEAYELRQVWLRRMHGHPTEAAWSLAGKDLACWCPLGQPCHADVLLELSNS